MPLHDEDGTALWPELMERLDAAPKYGTLIVTRDRLDRRRKVDLPWKQDYFRHRVAEIRKAAGIDFDVKFMGLRHGGNTESGNADLTDAQIRALSGHKTSAMTALYTKATMRQRRAAARKRLQERTKEGNLSK
jgi:integrase